MNEKKKENVFSAIILALMLIIIVAEIVMFGYLLHYISEMFIYGEQVLRQMSMAH
jgi:hypothetical protein